MTVHGAQTKQGSAVAGVSLDEFALPPAPIPGAETSSILVVGIGGTGVVTIGAILCMAAHLEGKAASVVDQTGLSQKNGAVSSHVRIAADPAGIAAARIASAEADVLLGCDMITAGGAEAMKLVRCGETAGVINNSLTATAAFTIDNSIDFQAEQIRQKLRSALARDRTLFVDATSVAAGLLGNSIGANMFMVGAALQRGLLPVSAEAIEKAIQLNGVAVSFNLQALRLGRLAVCDPERLKALDSSASRSREGSLRLSETLEEIIERRFSFLTDYQDARYAQRYRDTVAAVRDAEEKVWSGNALTEAVARNLFGLMAYKDEYEVARLYTSGEFEKKLKKQFSGSYTLKFHLAPPLFARKDPLTGHPRKVAFGSYMLHVFRLLAKLKGLRGTKLDPFGLTIERRMERQMIVDYERVIQDILPRLCTANIDSAAKLACYPDRIRGFGHIKTRNLVAALEEREKRLSQFRDSVSPALEAAELSGQSAQSSETAAKPDILRV